MTSVLHTVGRTRAGVWDDRKSGDSADFGGHCADVSHLVHAKLDPAAEVLTIHLPQDTLRDGWEPAARGQDVSSIQCIRPRTSFRHMLIPRFGASCAEDIDLPLLREYQQLVRISVSVARLVHETWLDACRSQPNVDNPLAAGMLAQRRAHDKFGLMQKDAQGMPQTHEGRTERAEHQQTAPQRKNELL